ncbi:zinc-dependent alcohol dehydrogenase family protein [Paenibacillus filicis]|uniref:Zinc-dependent alcohol dehydrogenase family protein n=1 Tax=Paenibacillus filicis TaxID=669464 RepID=A0ABU9DTS3_9BACL
MKARRIRYYEFGEPQDVIKVEHALLELPAPGELVVRMLASPINPSDLIPIRGSYAHRIMLPATPGYEGVGVVEEVGSSVSREWLGRRVLPLRGEGTWQEYVKAPVEWAVPVPAEIDDYSAAQLYINPITAWVTCTELLRLARSGKTLLVNACGSAIGRIYAQLSQVLGFRLIAVTRSGRHTAELLGLGAEHVICTPTGSLYEAVMDLTRGRGADAAIDAVGGASGEELAMCVRTGGMFLTIGLLSGEPLNWASLLQRNPVHAKLFHLRHWNSQIASPAWHATFRHMMELTGEGRLRLDRPEAIYELSAVHEAVRTAASGSGGKRMLTMGELLPGHTSI